MAGGVRRVFLSPTSELRDFPRERSFVACAESAVARARFAVTDMAFEVASEQGLPRLVILLDENRELSSRLCIFASALASMVSGRRRSVVVSEMRG